MISDWEIECWVLRHPDALVEPTDCPWLGIFQLAVPTRAAEALEPRRWAETEHDSRRRRDSYGAVARAIRRLRM